MKAASHALPSEMSDQGNGGEEDLRRAGNARQSTRCVSRPPGYYLDHQWHAQRLESQNPVQRRLGGLRIVRAAFGCNAGSRQRRRESGYLHQQPKSGHDARFGANCRFDWRLDVFSRRNPHGPEASGQGCRCELLDLLRSGRGQLGLQVPQDARHRRTQGNQAALETALLRLPGSEAGSGETAGRVGRGISESVRRSRYRSARKRPGGGRRRRRRSKSGSIRRTFCSTRKAAFLRAVWRSCFPT